jgi:type I restriction enzyme, R subunit
MSNSFTESIVEEAAICYFQALGYTHLHSSDIAPGEPNAERNSYSEVILENRLREALTRINPQLPTSAIDEALRQTLRTETQNLLENNRRFHRLLIDGVPVTYQKDDRTTGDGALDLWIVIDQSINHLMFQVRHPQIDNRTLSVVIQNIQL